MKWKNRLTNYNFWISLVSAVLLILQAFNFELDIAYISEIVTAVLGLLVVIGIISDPTKIAVSIANAKTKEEDSNVNIKAEQEKTVVESFEKKEDKPELVENDVATPLVEEKQVVPNVYENENFNGCDESNFQTVMNYLTKEIEKASEKLKADSCDILEEVKEISNIIENNSEVANSENVLVSEAKNEELTEVETIKNVYNIVN